MSEHQLKHQYSQTVTRRSLALPIEHSEYPWSSLGYDYMLREPIAWYTPSGVGTSLSMWNMHVALGPTLWGT